MLRDYLACKGNVESVRAAHGVSESRIRYVLLKLGVWKRWSPVPSVRRCAHCRRPLERSRNAYHWDCRRKAEATNLARILKRARKLLEAGLTVKAVAARVNLSAGYVSQKLPGVALTNEQRRRRGLPPATRQPRSPLTNNTARSRAQREMDRILVPVPVPPTHRGRPPERLDALERRAIKAYLACRGDVESVARVLGRSSGWLLKVLARGQVWQRWKKRPSPRPPCVVCGRPLPNLTPGARHWACWREQEAQRKAAWIARAKKLLAKGWTLQQVADHLGVSMSAVYQALPGHSRAEEVWLAALDARLRRFARFVKAGLSRREAGRRVGYAVSTAQKAHHRARRKGYL